MSTELQIPKTAPVMVLPDCNFFPRTPLTLYIFEPRYREMLAHVLKNDRMFCIGTIPGGESEAEVDWEAGIYRHGTLGLVRACVKNDDGTSHLVLEGLERVGFKHWTQTEPFRVASVERVETGFIEDEEYRVPSYVFRLNGLIQEMKAANLPLPTLFDDQDWNNLNPEVFADWVANYFVDDVHARHVLLGQPDLEQRLVVLIRWLQNYVAAKKAE